MAGVIPFMAIAIVMRFGQAPAGKIVIAYLAVGMAAMCVVARILVPRQIVRGGIALLLKTRRPDELGRMDLYPIYQTQMIVACAVLEGAAFFNLISYMTEGQMWTLGVVIVLLALMATSFPTAEKVNNWADEQLRRIQLDPPR